MKGCEYAEKGFLSRRMRDDHLDLSHKATPPGGDSGTENKVMDIDEIKSLLLDLVKADQVTQVQRYLTDYQDRKELLPLQTLRETAAQFSSRAMMETLFPQNAKLGEEYGLICRAAVEGGNWDTSKYLLTLWWNQRSTFLPNKLVRSIFDQDSEELRRMWISALTTSPSRAQNTKDGNLAFNQRQMFSKAAIGCTADQPARELFLLSIWATRLQETTLNDKAKLLGSTLLHVAASTSSINVAEWLVDRGAEVDYRFGECRPTPLRTTAKKDSHQAALLLRFLLFRGADPTIRHRNGARRLKGNELADPIEEEKGPKNISKWLGISWTELVAQAAAANGREVDTSADSQYNPDSDPE